MTLRWTGRSGAMLALAGLSVMFGGTASGAVVSVRHPAAASCRSAAGPFHVSGTKVVGARGRVFVPYGITVPGLAISDYRPFIALDDAKIRVTATAWCASTVRLQISQANLVGTNGKGFSRPFLRAVEGQVKVAENNHLVVVLSAQTEDAGNQPAPTKATVLFWKDLSRVYRHDPR